MMTLETESVIFDGATAIYGMIGYQASGAMPDVHADITGRLRAMAIALEDGDGAAVAQAWASIVALNRSFESAGKTGRSKDANE